MRILKLLFSRGIIVFLAFVLQIALVVTIAYYFAAQFLAFQIVSVLIGMMAFCHLLNRKQSPEFKLAWLFLLLGVPLFGVILYALFANPRMPRSQAKKLSHLRKLTQKHIGEDGDGDGVIAPAFRGVATYLKTQTGLPVYRGGNAVYFAEGLSFWQDLKEALAGAKKYIFMEYFIISPGKMWDEIHKILLSKVREGVEVRVMYDDIGTLGKLPGGYAKKLRGEGIYACKFNPFRPIVSGVYNNRDHRKITVIDGEIGYTGGVNIGDEYINVVHPFGHWKDTAVKVTGAPVQAMCALFLQMYNLSDKKEIDLSAYIDTSSNHDSASEGAVQFFGDSPRPHDSEQIGENNFLNLIGAAREYLYLSTPYLVLDYSLITALRNAAERGVDVRIIVPHIPDKKAIFRITRSNYAYLIGAGVKIYEYTPGFIHAKGLVADDEVAFVGTINFDYRSFVHHYECGMMLYGAPCIEDIKADFFATMEQSQLITLENYKYGRFLTLGGAILNLFSPML